MARDKQIIELVYPQFTVKLGFHSLTRPFIYITCDWHQCTHDRELDPRFPNNLNETTNGKTKTTKHFGYLGR